MKNYVSEEGEYVIFHLYHPTIHPKNENIIPVLNHENIPYLFDLHYDLLFREHTIYMSFQVKFDESEKDKLSWSLISKYKNNPTCTILLVDHMKQKIDVDPKQIFDDVTNGKELELFIPKKELKTKMINIISKYSLLLSTSHNTSRVLEDLIEWRCCDMPDTLKPDEKK